MPTPFTRAIDKLKGFLNNNAMSKKTSASTQRVIPSNQHTISTKHISDAALRVMSTLHKAGFDGYLVGGGVRDLLLGGHPKDFDIATDATPEQVNRLFRNARIIGRRFKIVHVRFGREVIEVTTFRGSHQTPEESHKGRRPTNQQSARSQNGMLLRDNVFGTVEEDAIRRDLTINALYYTTVDHAIHDYTNGLQDLDNKLIRIIGDPETRFKEDPVRMLRVVRFAAKLGFNIEKNTAKPINTLSPSLADIPAARMFDEVLKLFMAGYAVKTFELMQQYSLFRPLFPQTHSCLEDPYSQRLIAQAMKNTDIRINQGKPVTPAFIFAALLWPAVHKRQQQLIDQGMPVVPALHQASNEVVSIQQQSTSIPRRFGMPMREIWDLQLRLPKRGGRRAEELLENRRFRAAYDFLLLREQAGENTDGLGQWWTDYQNQSPDQRAVMTSKLTNKSPRKRRKRNHTDKHDGNATV
jgi:poly(A) polymerase